MQPQHQYEHCGTGGEGMRGQVVSTSSRDLKVQECPLAHVLSEHCPPVCARTGPPSSSSTAGCMLGCRWLHAWLALRSFAGTPLSLAVMVGACVCMWWRPVACSWQGTAMQLASCPALCQPCYLTSSCCELAARHTLLQWQQQEHCVGRAAPVGCILLCLTSRRVCCAQLQGPVLV